MLKGQARNCNIIHSLSQQFYFSSSKCCQKNKTKQNKLKNTVVPYCHQFAWIHQSRLQGESIHWQAFLSILFEAWGCGDSVILLFCFLGLWVLHNPKNAASAAEQRKTAAFSHISSPWSQEIHRILNILGWWWCLLPEILRSSLTPYFSTPPPNRYHILPIPLY